MEINDLVLKYVADVKKSFQIDRAYLFGSYAKGLADNGSDIDLCFFSKNFENKRSIDVLTQLLKISRKYNEIDIEPHAFPASELTKDNPFVKEIINTGIEI
ncbi:MAG: nucleotidyltransferase domain-containing protein [Oscillospiraceae bacterium]|jgi:predicted nucleotidyltransferase|nr:nucleotidyltransferase domain-containing protein [Oscillospiraceae bacterium]